MSRMLDLVALGAANVDLLLYTDNFPEPDQEMHVKSLEMQAGGSAANVAVGLNRLGKKSGFIGKVGTDYFGKFLIEEFKKENVDISNLKIEEGSSGLVTAIVDKNGERILLVNEGVQSTLSKEDIHKDYIQNSKILFIHSVIGKDVIEALEVATKYAKEADVKVFFDPGFMFAEMGIEKFKKILENTSILKLNEEEIKVFTNCQNIEESFKLIHDYGPKIIILTSGKDGCIVNFENEVKKISVPPNVNVIDTTGAGDAFSAGFIQGIIECLSLEDCGRYGNATAGLCVSTKGARFQHSLEDVKKFLKVI